MAILVRLLGVLVVVFGVIYLLNPNAIKPYMAFWTERKRIYMGAVPSLLIGIVLLLAASQCKMTWFVATFGILGLIKGILLLIVGQKKIISMLKWWQKRSVVFLRLHALITLLIGILLFYSA